MSCSLQKATKLYYKSLKYLKVLSSHKRTCVKVILAPTLHPYTQHPNNHPDHATVMSTSLSNTYIFFKSCKNNLDYMLKIFRSILYNQFVLYIYYEHNFRVKITLLMQFIFTFFFKHFRFYFFYAKCLIIFDVNMT